MNKLEDYAIDPNTIPDPGNKHLFEYVAVKRDGSHDMQIYTRDIDPKDYWVIHVSSMTKFIDLYSQSKRVPVDFSDRKLSHYEITRLPYYYRAVYLYVYYCIHDKNPGILLPIHDNNLILENIRQIRKKIDRNSFRIINWHPKLRWAVNLFGTIKDFTKWRKMNEKVIKKYDGDGE